MMDKKKTTNKKKGQENVPNNHKITDFFGKKGEEEKKVPPKVTKGPSGSGSNGVVIKLSTTNEVKAMEVVNLSSDSDGDNDGKTKDETDDASAFPSRDSGSPDSGGDDLIAGIDEVEVIRLSQEKSKSQSPSNGDDDGLQCTPPPTPLKSKVFNTSPVVKSPKVKMTRGSPLARLNQLRNNSQSRSPGRGSPSTSRSPFRTPTPPSSSSRGRSRSVSESPNNSARKRLQFPNGDGRPYDLRNFESVITSVFSDPFHAHLLDNEEDKGLFQAYHDLSFKARCLYVKLFQRKWMWNQISKYNYPKISEDLKPVFDELLKANFVITLDEVINDVDLPAVLNVLDKEKMVELGKQMNVTSDKKGKNDYRQALLEMASAKNPKFTFSQISTTDIIKKKAIKLLDTTYQLEGKARSFFTRLFILHSPPMYWDDEQEQSRNQLLRMLLEEMGSMVYPEYKLNRETPLYKDRHELIKFHEAWTLHCDITAHLEAQDWDQVIKIGEETRTMLQNIINDPDTAQDDQNLPMHLRMFRIGSVFTRICWLAVQGHEKLKDYEKANVAINFLLGQTTYLPHYRGRWYGRIVINQGHLKVSKEERLTTLKDVLTDEAVSDYHKLDMSERLKTLMDQLRKEKLKQRNKKKKTKKPRKKRRKIVNSDDESVESDEDLSIGEQVDECIEVELIAIPGFHCLSQELPTKIIEGQKIFNPASQKSTWVTKKDGKGESKVTSVEEFAICHYHSEGFSYGLHHEGSTVVSLFGLLFWDEIYMDNIPDSFYTKHQAYPLDLNFADFFTRREGFFVDKLENMRSVWTIEDALVVVEANWAKHLNVSSLVNWGAFGKIDLAKSLLRALGLPITTSICERLAKGFRLYRSGFPDLTIWNDHDFKFVEVKGPGDTLSSKQKIWIDFLLSIGAKAEVCLVKEISGKKLN